MVFGPALRQTSFDWSVLLCRGRDRCLTVLVPRPLRSL